MVRRLETSDVLCDELRIEIDGHGGHARPAESRPALPRAPLSSLDAALSRLSDALATPLLLDDRARLARVICQREAS